MSREFRKIIRSAIYVTDGEWSEEIGTALMGELKQLIVLPENKDTSYTFALIDEDELPIYMNSTRGTLVTGNLELPLLPGLKRFVITNSSANELFRIKLIYQP